MQQHKKTAVVLMNLGGPSEMAAIKPFLFNFFMDKNIIQLPLPFRYMLAQWIAWSRSKGAAKEAYGKLGGKSPLLYHTQQQAAALETVLQQEGKQTQVFVSMRYWHPMSDEVVQQVKAYQPDEIILLPLYPQYSTTTFFSSVQDWHVSARKHGLTVKTSEACCYPEEVGFIAASVENIRAVLKDAPKNVRLLFSAHGLPEKIIQQGDPYQKHCEATAAAIVKALNIEGLDWTLCYQSKVGRLKWIGPSIDEELERAAADKIGVVVYPCAFVSEHVETLVELDMEYAHRAKHVLNLPYFGRAQTVSTHPAFITGLKNLVHATLAQGVKEKSCPCVKGS